MKTGTIKLIKIFMLASVLCAPLSGLAQAQQHVSTLTLKDESVGALFESFDPSGCILTDVSLSADSFQEYADTGKPPPSSHECSLSTAQVDICEGSLILIADGLTATDSLVIEKDLSGATLKAHIVMLDGQYGVNFTAIVDIAFTATGPLVPSTGVTVDKSTPGTVLVTEFHGESRDAQAVGTITIPDHPVLGTISNLTLKPSSLSSIQRVTNRSVTTIHTAN